MRALEDADAKVSEIQARRGYASGDDRTLPGGVLSDLRHAMMQVRFACHLMM